MKKFLFSLILILGFLSFGVVNADSEECVFIPQDCFPICQTEPAFDEEVCNTHSAFCYWYEENNCRSNCYALESEQVCNSLVYCYWDSMCYAKCDTQIGEEACNTYTSYPFDDPYSVLSDSIATGTTNVFSSLTSNIWRIVGLGVLVILIFFVWRAFRRFTR